MRPFKEGEGLRELPNDRTTELPKDRKNEPWNNEMRLNGLGFKACGRIAGEAAGKTKIAALLR